MPSRARNRKRAKRRAKRAFNPAKAGRKVKGTSDDCWHWLLAQVATDKEVERGFAPTPEPEHAASSPSEDWNRMTRWQIGRLIAPEIVPAGASIEMDLMVNYKLL